MHSNGHHCHARTRRLRLFPARIPAIWVRTIYSLNTRWRTADGLPTDCSFKRSCPLNCPPLPLTVNTSKRYSNLLRCRRSETKNNRYVVVSNVAALPTATAASRLWTWQAPFTQAVWLIESAALVVVRGPERDMAWFESFTSVRQSGESSTL